MPASAFFRKPQRRLDASRRTNTSKSGLTSFTQLPASYSRTYCARLSITSYNYNRKSGVWCITCDRTLPPLLVKGRNGCGSHAPSSALNVILPNDLADAQRKMAQFITKTRHPCSTPTYWSCSLISPLVSTLLYVFRSSSSRGYSL